MNQHILQVNHPLNSSHVSQYILEFHSGLSYRIELFIAKYEANMIFDIVNLSHVIKLYMENYLEMEADHYVKSRTLGLPSSVSFHRIDRMIQLFCDTCVVDESMTHSNSLWQRKLEPVVGCVLVFSVDAENILADYRSENNIKGPVLFVTINDFPETEVEFPDNFSALQLPQTDVLHSDNPYLRRYFPPIHKIANSVLWLMSILRPSSVILYETDAFECMIVRCATESYKIPLTIR